MTQKERNGLRALSRGPIETKFQGHFNSLVEKKLATRKRLDLEYSDVFVFTITEKGLNVLHGKEAEPTVPRKRSQRDPQTATTGIRGSIAHFLMVLSSKLTQYDVKQSTKRFYNTYALGHYLGALHRVEEHIKYHFHPGVLATGEVGAQLARSIAAEFDPNFPPVKNVLKQLHTFVTSGKTPKLTG